MGKKKGAVVTAPSHLDQPDEGGPALSQGGCASTTPLRTVGQWCGAQDRPAGWRGRGPCFGHKRRMTGGRCGVLRATD